MTDNPEQTGADTPQDSVEESPGAPEQVLQDLKDLADGPVLWDDYEDPLYLFAFDHLMDQAYIARFVRGLRPAKLVWLPHHRLCWPFYLPPQETAVPSLERTNSDEDNVWGILYQANHKDLTRLEEHLRVPNRYYRKSLVVMDRGSRRLSAFCYALNHEAIDAHKPSAAYMERLIEAAVSRKLPDEWISRLKAIETE